MPTPTKEIRESMAKLTKVYNTLNDCSKALNEVWDLMEKAGVKNFKIIMDAKNDVTEAMSSVARAQRQIK